MIKRLIYWVLGLTILLALVVFIVLPLLANTEEGRNKLAQGLSRALNREVSIGGLEVGFFFSSLEVRDLKIANPEGYPEGSFLQAGRLSLDASLRRLLDGVVEGSLGGRGLDVHIITKGDGSNLDGLAKKGEKEEKSGDGPDLDLRLELLDSRLTMEDLDKNEKLVVEGVGLEMRLSNRQGVSDADLKIRIRSIDSKGLRVRDIEVDARRAGEKLDLERIGAALPGGGRLEGSGSMQGQAWNASLAAKRVGLESDMLPFVAAVYPFAAQAGGQLDGSFEGSFDLSGQGLTGEAIKRSLAGTGNVTLSGMRLPQNSVIALLAAAAGRPAGAMDINDAGAQFSVKEGWLDFQRISASGKEARYDLAGRVSLDGELDLTMDILPLVKQFGGGDAYGKVAKYVKELPFRIKGTTVAPKLRPPKLDDALEAAAKGALEKEAGKLFDKLKKK